MSLLRAVSRGHDVASTSVDVDHSVNLRELTHLRFLARVARLSRVRSDCRPSACSSDAPILWSRVLSWLCESASGGIRTSCSASLIGAIIAGAIVCGIAPPSRAQPLCQTTTPPTYYYDSGGRLSAVLGPSYGTTIYSYDATGNILTITHNPIGTLTALQVCPGSAQPGQSVAIFGTGFTSGASVTFNGTPAAGISVSSANQISAVVPAGASSGPVSVTVGTATSVAPTRFAVGPPGPQITQVQVANATTLNGFIIANPYPFYVGTGANLPTQLSQIITITGTGFDTTTPLTNNKNKVFIGGRAATLQSASATSLTAQLPIGGPVWAAGTPAAPIMVETPNGSASSTASLLLAPASVTPILAGQAITASMIDDVETGALGASATTLTFQEVNTTHYGAVVFSVPTAGVISASVTFNQPQACSGSSTNCPAQANMLLIGPDGSPVNIATKGGVVTTTAVNGSPIPNQSQQFWAPVQAGAYALFVQNGNIGGSSGTTTAAVALSVVPATAILNSGNPYTPGAVGTPTLITTPSLQAYQNASFIFTAPNDGNRITLLTTLSSVNQSPFYVTVTAPDGFTRVYSSDTFRSDFLRGLSPPGQVDFSGPISAPSTPQGSLYTVVYNAQSATGGTVTFQLVELPADQQQAAGWPSANGTQGYQFAAGQPGQGVELLFPPGAPPAGVNTLLTIASNCFGLSITDTGLNQQFYRNLQCGGSDFTTGGLALPPGSQGPYRVQAYFIGEQTGQISFGLANGASLAAAPITLGGTVQTQFTARGQVATLIYTPLTAPSYVKLATTLAASWQSPTQCMMVTLQPPSGSVAPPVRYYQCPAGAGYLGNPGGLDSIRLATTGTYTITLEPTGALVPTGPVSTTLSQGTTPAFGTLPLGVPVTRVVPGSGTTLTSTFQTILTANAFLNLVTQPNIVGGANVPGNCYTDTLVSPSGQQLYPSAGQTESNSCAGNDASGPIAQPATGTYSATFTPNAALSGTFSQIAYNFSPTTTTPVQLAVAGTGSSAPSGVSVPLTYPGQQAMAQFTVTAPQFVNVYAGRNFDFQQEVAVGMATPQQLTTMALGGCLELTVQLTGGSPQTLFNDSGCGDVGFVSGAIFLPAAGTYEITVNGSGSNNFGLVTIGVGPS